MRRLVVRTDGAARGNPGPAGAGWVIETPEGVVVSEGCAYLGESTNNQAEYEALLRALDEVAPDRETEVEVLSDSELMVKQLRGEYRVKSEGLKPLYVRAVRHLLRAGRSHVRHVPRGENAAADALANQAIDAYALEES
ncbi:MAG: ribonuclease HI family protein [Gemmatimonadetes bacterium]|nr:ribonuclease HI family protein [Gemmatimonadota bacterium]